jgi:hypothetical protein
MDIQMDTDPDPVSGTFRILSSRSRDATTILTVAVANRPLHKLALFCSPGTESLECNGDFSPVATGIYENSCMTGLPNLHDGFFDGVWLSADKSVRLFVRTVAGERSTIVLTDVEALNINGLRTGNIIFELVLIAPDKLTMEDMTQVYDLKPDEAEQARKLLSNARERSLSALEMNTSYGAEGKVLFRAMDAIPEHVLA